MSIFKKKKPDILKVDQQTTPKERAPLAPPPTPPASVVPQVQIPQPVMAPQTPGVTNEILLQALQEIYQYLNEFGAYVHDKLEELESVSDEERSKIQNEKPKEPAKKGK